MVNKNGQATLEASCILVAIILLLFGIFRFWLWFNVDIADRSGAFNNTRIVAASNPDRANPLLLEDYFNQRTLDERDFLFVERD